MGAVTSTIIQNEHGQSKSSQTSATSPENASDRDLLIGAGFQGERLKMIAENHSPVTACTQAERRQWLNQLSLAAGEDCGPYPMPSRADLPLCCVALSVEDDPSRMAGVNFWDVDASGDADSDKAWGEFLAEDAVRYVRAHPGTEILTGILYWMGAALRFEERCPGPLENGFVYRVLRDYPDAVEQMFAAVYRQCPERLN
jgi:hypothetical protein